MKRILLIEDYPAQRLLYRQEFEADGYEVLEAASCDTAYSLLSAQNIDLIILDLFLPNGSGLELLDEIVVKRRDLPVIINTTHDAFRFNFKTWGADAFVLKSSDLTELKSRVSQLLFRDFAAAGLNGTAREN